MGQATTVEFDPFSRDFFDDPYDTYAALRDHAPCYYSEQYDFYALSRFDDVVAGHRDHATFTSTHGQTYEQLASGQPADTGAIISMDPPRHTRYRKLVSRSFTPRSIGNYESLVREIISGYLDPLMGRRQFDILEEFAAPFPVEIISSILGVPPEDRQQIRLWTDAMLHREEGSALGSQAAREGGMAQGMYLYELSVKKRQNPADDMLSALIEAEVETEDGDLAQLNDAEIAEFGTLLAAAGSETVTKLVGNAVVLFHRHRDQWAKVLDDPAVIANAVEEILRYWAPSQYQGRYSMVDSEWHGVTIPKHKPVFLITGSANRDPRRYGDPDKFDITREAGLAVGLGHGLHVCLGAALARLESRVAIEEIARRWPAFEVQESCLRRVQMSNVAGYSSVPITVS
ncbi:cytochrome P450 [Candidatus Poriferisocius sp.]|uniref:cytochrome P450 n=1 Tax=Candidatus Poriferisocius sp. TaxID=3101276 RepID=UPI003B01A07C